MGAGVAATKVGLVVDRIEAGLWLRGLPALAAALYPDKPLILLVPGRTTDGVDCLTARLLVSCLREVDVAARDHSYSVLFDVGRLIVYTKEDVVKAAAHFQNARDLVVFCAGFSRRRPPDVELAGEVVGLLEVLHGDG